MIGYLSSAVAQLSDPKLRRVLWIALLGAVFVFAALWAVVWWLVGFFDPSAVWGLSWLAERFGETFDWFAGIAIGLTLVLVTFLMFPAVMTILMGFLLEDVAGAVEQRHYPAAGAARPQPMPQIVLSTVKFAAVAILLNILVLPLYLVLFILPGANLVLYYLLNGYLLGREYYELVAFRRLPPGQATQLRRRYRSRVLVAGMIVAVLMTVPVVNLVAPILGAAFMVHVTHDLLRRLPSV